MFAIGDLDLGILTTAIMADQIKNQLSMSAVKPYFLHFVFGTNADKTEKRKLQSQMGFVGPQAGLGASVALLERIDKIDCSDIPNSISAMQEMIENFANMTRLPLSFFKAERQSGGLGDTGESTDEVKVRAKKKQILKHLEYVCSEMFAELGIEINYGIYEQQELEAEAEKDALMNQSKENQGDVKSG
jgi:hypothetical protein